MNMATIPCFRHGRFGHECDRLAVLRGDFFCALLEQDMIIRHFHRRRISQVDLVLAATPFAFAVFNGHSRSPHEIANGAEQRFVAQSLHRVIIDAVIT